jgi:DNA-binding GntR family transcriptional regulator
MALGELVQEGILRRGSGRGTFILGPHLEKSLLAYFKFAEKDTSELIIPESKIMRVDDVLPPTEVAKAPAIGSRIKSPESKDYGLSKVYRLSSKSLFSRKAASPVSNK